MRLGLDVVRDEARPPLRGDGASHAHCTRMIGIVGIEQRQDGTRVPEDAARHSSSSACLSRAPGAFPPPRPAPMRRKMGESSVSAGTAAGEPLRRGRLQAASAGTSRRPPRRMLGNSPRWMRRHTVDRDTPSARPAASTVIRFCDTNRSYHRSSRCLIVSLDQYWQGPLSSSPVVETSWRRAASRWRLN